MDRSSGIYATLPNTLSSTRRSRNSQWSLVRSQPPLQARSLVPLAHSLQTIALHLPKHVFQFRTTRHHFVPRRLFPLRRCSHRFGFLGFLAHAWLANSFILQSARFTPTYHRHRGKPSQNKIPHSSGQVRAYHATTTTRMCSPRISYCGLTLLLHILAFLFRRLGLQPQRIGAPSSGFSP